MDIVIRVLEAGDTVAIDAAFTGIGWRSRRLQIEGYLREQESGERVGLVAYSVEQFAGYVTVNWKPVYSPFAERGIPLIQDLNVLPPFRRRHIASRLVDEAERRIFDRSPTAGIGVGLYSDYGPAQRMYVLRGYVPDGRGLTYNDQPVAPGHEVRVDDDLILFFTKERPENVQQVL
ncbi:MAG: hypothetical protein A2147_01445 [Chloroflexi bacterium RBG_16_57_8]|nr:MAG: hypothetical protein A2147_01445 [Chloroflexi bacterium RBG_16_57_8]